MEELNAPLSDLKMIKKYFDGWTMISGFDYTKRAKYSEEMKYGTQEEVKLLNSIFCIEAHNELVLNTTNIIYWNQQEEAERYVPYIRKLQGFEC